jgi:hypothetical protein
MATKHHFAGARKMIMLDKGGERKLPDYHFAGAGKVITIDANGFRL